jgi:hypothetical protein
MEPNQGNETMVWKKRLTWLGIGAAALVVGMTGVESCSAQGVTPETNVLFATGFDFAKGYDPGFTLVGQNGWVGYGSGGNGLVTNFFAGYGQQAFVGFSAPNTNDDTLNVWQPIDYTPGGTNAALVQFSVLMEIADSTNGQYDDFRWSVYNDLGTNAAPDRLFTLDFDNYYRQVYYALDNTNGFISTGVSFTNESAYALVINMDFARNLWSATLNGMSVVNSQPLTTTNAVLNLGDVDAVWSVYDPAHPGDNYMVFDDYRVQAIAVPSIPPTLESAGALPDGRFLLRLYGEPDVTYTIEGSTNLVQWTSLGNVSSSSGTNDFVDDHAPGHAARFYRASALPEVAGLAR